MGTITIGSDSYDYDNQSRAIGGTITHKFNPALSFNITKQSDDKWFLRVNRQELVGIYNTRNIALGVLVGLYTSKSGHKTSFATWMNDSITNRGSTIDAVVAALAGDLIATNAVVSTLVGGTEARISADSSTLYPDTFSSLKTMSFRDVSKNGTWTDDGFGCLWDMDTDATAWKTLIGSSGGRFDIYETGTSTLIFSLTYAEYANFSSSTEKFNVGTIDFEGSVPSNGQRVDVRHVKSS
jgi:hypothetical protein